MKWKNLLATFTLSALAVCGATAQDSDKIKAEKTLSGDAVAKTTEKLCVAVHDFTISADLQKAGVNGWSLAELFESELAKGGHWKLVTRAKIAKALKEQKFSAEGSLEAAKAGKLLGADCIVTGALERKGSLLILTAKLIDASKETGKIERSFSIVREIGSGDFNLACLAGMVESASKKLVMTPPEFLVFGKRMLEEGDLLEARDAFQALCSIAPSPESKALATEVEKSLERKRAEAEASLAEASKLFLSSKDSQNGELCARAIKLLERELYAPRPFLSPEQKARAEALLAQARDFKKGLYNGPSQAENWVVPELGVELMPVKEGSFKMGAVDNEENPLHQVRITRMFWIGRTEITIAQFLCHLKDAANQRIDARDNEIDWDSETCPLTKEYRMKEGKSETWGEDSMPMVDISWVGANNFCKWLTLREKAAKRLPQGYVYRLPTEAEWEYACLAGGEAVQGDAAAKTGWNGENSGGAMHPVGKKQANAFGLVDVCGNAWEWCYDWYDGPLLPVEATDPKGPPKSEDDQKVMRGGSAKSKPSDVSSFSRAGTAHKQAKGNIGFRIVCAPEF